MTANTIAKLCWATAAVRSHEYGCHTDVLILILYAVYWKCLPGKMKLLFKVNWKEFPSSQITRVVCVCVTQSLCFRIQKMMEVYRPDWCEKREDWSIYLFSPQNKYVLLQDSRSVQICSISLIDWMFVSNSTPLLYWRIILGNLYTEYWILVLLLSYILQIIPLLLKNFTKT